MNDMYEVDSFLRYYVIYNFPNQKIY